MFVAKGQLEDRDVIIGYFEGHYEDIDSYVNFHHGNKYYNVSIDEILPIYVPVGFSKDLIRLNRDKAALEQELKKLNELITLKQRGK